MLRGAGALTKRKCLRSVMVGMPMITACNLWCLLTLSVTHLLIDHGNSENANLRRHHESSGPKSDKYDVQT